MTIAPTRDASTNQAQALELIDRVISRSEADGVFVSLGSAEEALSRFSGNQITQNVNESHFSLTVTSYFGSRSASASTNDLDSEAIDFALRNSEALARIAPEDPEWVPLLEAQHYDERVAAFDEATARFSPMGRAELIRRACILAERSGVEASGTLSTASSLRAIGNSRGLRAAGRGTTADFGFTARVADGSSWGEGAAWAMGQLATEALASEVIDRARRAQSPRTVVPGTYPVILSAAAAAELVRWFGWNLDARAADEGRSFMSAEGQASRLGETLFSPLVQLRRDPAHPLLQTNPFFADGLANRSLPIVRDGIVENLSYGRFWAAKQGKQATGPLAPLVMDGSEQSLADLIAQTERGILVSRAWYVRYISPKELTVTGMTRDGTFWIEDGKIAFPIKNLRFNQSLPHLLRDIDGLSLPERHGMSVMPGVRAKAFTFTSVTDSI